MLSIILNVNSIQIDNFVPISNIQLHQLYIQLDVDGLASNCALNCLFLNAFKWIMSYSIGIKTPSHSVAISTNLIQIQWYQRFRLIFVSSLMIVNIGFHFDARIIMSILHEFNRFLYFTFSWLRFIYALWLRLSHLLTIDAISIRFLY